MNVVATGVIVRKEPEGFTVVAWHRHDVAFTEQCDDDTYTQLTEPELMQVLAMHLASYLPGDECETHTPWPQQRFF